MGNPQNPSDFDAAATAAATQDNGPVGEIVFRWCQSDNWIRVRYEYEDGTGVPGAAYVVQSVTQDSTPTGDVLAEGLTDANGDAYAVLPPGYEQVEFYFHADPQGDPYEEPEVEARLKEPEPGFFTQLWQWVSAATDWVWGIIKGDFEEDASTSQIIARMILTMIPGVDQIADGQDIVYILYKLIWKKEYNVTAHWILLFITLIGLIPTLGSLAKGILKLVWKKADDLLGLYRIFNFFKKGNAHRWLRDFANDLTGKHLSSVRTLLNRLLDRAVMYMQDAKKLISFGWNSIIEEGIAKIGQFRRVVDSNLTSAAQTLKTKLLEALSKAMTRIFRRTTKNEKPYVVRQQKQAPPRFKRSQDEMEDLARDPAHRGNIDPKSIREREVGLGLEEAGEVPGPIKRDPSGAAEFIDAEGQAWDVKGFNSNFPPNKGGFDLEVDAGKVDAELASGENVMLDTEKLSAEHLAALKQEAVKRGWGDRVKFW